MEAQMTFQHFVMIRFNLPKEKTHKWKKRLTPEWTEHRIRLFEIITFPSLLGQTCQNFEIVMMLCEDATPAEYVDHIKSWERDYPQLHLNWVNLAEHGLCLPNRAQKGFPPDAMEDLPQRAIAPYLDGSDWLITTMCDADDALHSQFIERIQAEAKEEPESLFFPLGGRLDVKNRVLYHQLKNPHHMFPTLVERMVGYKTVFGRKHSRVHLMAPQRYLPVDGPYFVRGIHERNTNNRARIVTWDRNPTILLAELEGFTFDLTLEGL
jgi:hypothetical protein